jgi:hypothetical protein
VTGVVEVRLQLANPQRGIDRHRDDPRANRAQKADHEVFVGREDECDAVALLETERL